MQNSFFFSIHVYFVTYFPKKVKHFPNTSPCSASTLILNLPFYSPGGKASFKEDVIFTTNIPIPKPDDLRIRDVKKTTTHDTIQETPQVIKFLEVLQGEMSREELLSKLELKDRVNLRKRYLNTAVESGFIELTLPDKPNSSKQKYRLTDRGKKFLKKG